MFANNVDFSGGNPVTGKVTTDGQLLIGATASPNIRVGTLSSSDSSITWTVGAGTISGVVAGGTTVGKTITGNTGGPLSPTAGNWNIVGSGSITVAGSGSTETIQLTGLTNHSLLVGAGTATLTNLGVATNGQLPIGSTGADPVLATLTASTGISVTNGAGSITLASTGSGMAWVDVTGTTQAMAVDTGYAANNASLVTLTLPTTSAAGSVIEVYYKGTGGWLIAQNASQQIRYSNQITTAGVTGSLASTGAGDCVRIRCITANLLWEVLGVQGALTVT